MAYILSYSSIAIHNAPTSTQFGGSSKYKVINGNLSEKIIDKPEPTKVFKTDNTDFEHGENHNIQTKGVNDDIPFKAYLLNKSKVRKRCHALSRLEKSKKFLAFYTITFPEKLTDKYCYQYFNLWLTRCRKSSGLSSYLWVAERQKNETIHFHLLTNDFMPIKTVNGYMAKTLSNAKKKGNEVLQVIETEKYNGVDVKKVGNKRKTLIGYLTKYITKNNIEFYRLPWHCSRDVSRLFTSQHFEDDQSGKCLEKLPHEKDKYFIHESEFCKVAAFKFIPNDEVFIDLDALNEKIYSSESKTPQAK